VALVRAGVAVLSLTLLVRTGKAVAPHETS